MTFDFWYPHKLQVEVNDGGSRHVSNLDQPFAVIGSHPDCDVVLSDLPPRKFYLHAQSEGVYVVDLKSRSERNSGNWLDPDSSIDFGNYRIFVTANGNVNDTSDPVNQLTAPGSRPDWGPTMTVFGNGEIIGEQVLSRVLTIFGRKKPSSARVSTRSLSDAHCALLLEAGQLWVIDLNSERGTYMDGQKIKAAKYEWGATIEMARIHLVCHLPAFETASQTIPGARQPASLSASRVETGMMQSDQGDSGSSTFQSGSSKHHVHDSLAGNWVESESMMSIENPTTDAQQDGTREHEEQAKQWEDAHKTIKEKLTAELDEMDALRIEVEQRRVELDQSQARLAADKNQLQIDHQSLNLAKSQFENTCEQLIEQQASEQAELDQLRTKLDERELELGKLEEKLNSERDAFEAEQTDVRLTVDLQYDRNTLRRERLTRVRKALQLRRQEFEDRLTNAERAETEASEIRAELNEQLEQLEAFLKEAREGLRVNLD